MMVGHYSESIADQAALAVFTEGILGETLEPMDMDLAATGVTDVLGTLSTVIRAIHFNSSAEALVVVLDGDDTELHELAHEAPGGASLRCRLCELRKIVLNTRSRLKPRPGKSELKIALGLAIPAIEAWYLVGNNHQVGEAAWRVGQANRKPPFTRPKLKELVYGTTRPSVEIETECGVREARRIIGSLNSIETAFPIGFGLMAKEIRSWKNPPQTPPTITPAPSQDPPLAAI